MTCPPARRRCRGSADITLRLEKSRSEPVNGTGPSGASLAYARTYGASSGSPNNGIAFHGRGRKAEGTDAVSLDRYATCDVTVTEMDAMAVIVITWLLVAMSTASLAVPIVVRLSWRDQGPMRHWGALAIGAFNLGSAAALLTLAGMNFVRLGEKWWLIAVPLCLGNVYCASHRGRPTPHELRMPGR